MRISDFIFFFPCARAGNIEDWLYCELSPFLLFIHTYTHTLRQSLTDLPVISSLPRRTRLSGDVSAASASGFSWRETTNWQKLCCITCGGSVMWTALWGLPNSLQSMEPMGQMFVLSILRWRILKIWAGGSKAASQLIHEWAHYVSYTVNIGADNRHPGFSNALIDKFTFRGSRALFTFQSFSPHTVFILGGKQCFDIQGELSYLHVCV